MLHKNDGGSKIFDFYIDKVVLIDLLVFYDIEYEIIRRYNLEDGFNKKINKFIEALFNLRLKYKQKKNPLESTIILLLNSMYNKSILNALKTETKCVSGENLFKYIWRNYNFITEFVDDPTIEKFYVKKLKPNYKHFNFPQFEASVFSWF